MAITSFSAPRRTSGTIMTLSLTEGERSRLQESYRHLHFPAGAQADHERFVTACQGWFLECAPRRTVEAIRRWHADRRDTGVLIIDNWGIDEPLPPTPIDGRRSPDKLTTYSEQVLTAVASLLGQVFAFAHERHGDLVQDLTPVKGKEKALTNEGAQRLGWHTEHASTGYLLGPTVNVCDYLLFFGLRADPQSIAKTLVADIGDALPLLSPEAIDVLRAPVFRARPPLLVRQHLPTNRQVIERVPVLSGPTNCPDVRVALYGDLTEAMTSEGESALAELSEALDAVQQGLPTVPGRLVLVDNGHVLHGRFPFQPQFDGRDRWLQRAMVTSSLRPFQEWQRESIRVLTPSP